MEAQVHRQSPTPQVANANNVRSRKHIRKGTPTVEYQLRHAHDQTRCVYDWSRWLGQHGLQRPATSRDSTRESGRRDTAAAGRGGTASYREGYVSLHQGLYQGIVTSEREYDDDTDMCVRSTGGAANAYVPSADEEKLVRQAEEEQLRRVYSRKEHEAAGESEEKK